jgi:hypothetical protein
MTLEIALQILRLGLSLLTTHTSGAADARVKIAETLSNIVRVAAQAYHAHVGEPIDPSLIKPEAAVLT